MSGSSPQIAVRSLANAKVAIISSSWHLELCNDLVAGAQRGLAQASITQIETIYVPGSFEIPLASQLAFEKGFDAVVAVGLVLKGETPHFDYVCQAVTNGLTQIAAETGKPIGFGVLTCDNHAQAKARAGFPGSIEDKGKDTAMAVLNSLIEHKKLG